MTTFKSTFALFCIFVSTVIFVGFMGMADVSSAQAVPAPAQEDANPTAPSPKATHRASLIMIGREIYSGYASASPEMSWAACLKAKQNFNDLLGRGARGYVCLDLETGDIAR